MIETLHPDIMLCPPRLGVTYRFFSGTLESALAEAHQKGLKIEECCYWKGYLYVPVGSPLAKTITEDEDY